MTIKYTELWQVETTTRRHIELYNKRKEEWLGY